MGWYYQVVIHAFGGANVDTADLTVTKTALPNAATANILDGTVGRDSFTGGLGANRDLIDLSAIDANALLPDRQALAFIGTAAFSGAAGELRYDVAGPDAIPQGSVNASLAFEIRLAGVNTLAGSDFSL